MIRYLIAMKRDFIALSTFRAMKRYFKGIFCAPHGNKPPKFPCDIWNAVRLRSQIFDSPGVKLYHFVDISIFR